MRLLQIKYNRARGRYGAICTSKSSVIVDDLNRVITPNDKENHWELSFILSENIIKASYKNVGIFDIVISRLNKKDITVSVISTHLWYGNLEFIEEFNNKKTAKNITDFINTLVGHTFLLRKIIA